MSYLLSLSGYLEKLEMLITFNFFRIDGIIVHNLCCLHYESFFSNVLLLNSLSVFEEFKHPCFKRLRSFSILSLLLSSICEFSSMVSVFSITFQKEHIKKRLNLHIFIKWLIRLILTPSLKISPLEKLGNNMLKNA